MISGLAIFIMLFSKVTPTSSILSPNINLRICLLLIPIDSSIASSRFLVTIFVINIFIMLRTITLILGTLCGYTLSTILYNIGAFYMAFQFPAAFTAIYTTVLIIVPLIIATICMHSFSKEPLTKRLREVAC